MNSSGIGLLNEKPLHSSLKEWYVLPGDRVEVNIDGYVIDIVRDHVLIEIQTGSFASIKSKLINLIQSHRIHIVYPVAQEKWIIKQVDDEGNVEPRRKSPKKGRVEDLFGELVSFPQLMANPSLAIEVLLIREEELRRFDEKRNWRRKGWGIEERRLIEVLDRKLFEGPIDWRELIPENIRESFTAKELAKATGIRNPLAQKMAYCLRKAGVIELTGKKERANLYKVGSKY
jgi:hypothetical protein